MRRANASRPGAALLEVIVALTILATSGATVVTLMAQSSHAVRRARETETELRRASALFDAVALWTRDDLDRHLGSRRQGPWMMHVDRTAQTLYSVALTDSLGARDLLNTTLFRPEPARAAP